MTKFENFPIYWITREKCSDTSFDVTINSQFSSGLNIRIIETCKATDCGFIITYTPYVHLDSLTSLYIGSKKLYARINGTQHDHTNPSISTGNGSVHDYSSGEQSPDIIMIIILQ